jgi:hypothetical protein
LPWEDVKFPEGVTAILSCAVSNFTNNGIIYNKPLTELTPDQVIYEIMKQCDIDHNLMVSYHIDRALLYDDITNTWNIKMPLFVSRPQDYPKLNDGSTKNAHFFVVGEFTRTDFTIPTMEKSCEAGLIGANKAISYLQKISLKTHMMRNLRNFIA